MCDTTADKTYRFSNANSMSHFKYEIIGFSIYNNYNPNVNTVRAESEDCVWLKVIF